MIAPPEPLARQTWTEEELRLIAIVFRNALELFNRRTAARTRT